jgi:hypothetical protein
MADHVQMNSIPASAQIRDIFANSDSGTVWTRTRTILGLIDPAYDTSSIQGVFDDVMSLFRGDYPGYSAIRTLYHDKPHTLDVFLCAVRLMHGLRASGTPLSDEEMTLVMMAALMHDIGYAQIDGEKGGSGAQYMQTHVKRAITFMRSYVASRQFPSAYAVSLEPMLHGTDPALTFSQIEFPDERTRLLGKIVATADLTGQMADRNYLERLLFLYLEFKEANFGNYQNMFDLLRRTKAFYVTIREKLDGPLGKLYTALSYYFRETLGVENNYYLESIEKNMAYLDRVIAQDEAGYLAMLRRAGIAERSQSVTTLG